MVLAWPGGLSLLLYGGLAWLSFDFDYGAGHANRPLLGVLGLLGTASALYLAALGYLLYIYRRGRSAGGANSSSREGSVLTVVLAFSLAFRLTLFFSVPIQEIDYYRYLWDGRVCLEGANPYRYSPAQIEWAPYSAPGSEAHGLWQLSQRTPGLAVIFARVHHREVPTVYPPAAQFVFAAAALFTPVSAPLWVHVGVLKVLVLGFDIGTVFLLVALLRRLHWPAVWCVAYAWCPLTIKEFANSAHLDSIAVFFTTLAVYCLVRFAGAAPTDDKKGEARRTKDKSRAILPGPSSSRRWATAGLVALGVAVLSKSYPVVLLPVVVAFLWARLGRRVLYPLGACALVIVVGYFPFLPARHAEWAARGQGVRAPGQPGNEGHHALSGLGTFLTRWQMNDLLFMVVHENLRRAKPGGVDAWFVAVPAHWRERLHGSTTHLLSGRVAEEVDPAFLLTQGLMALFFLALVLHWAHGVWWDPSPTVLLRACFLVLVWGWLLSSAQNPWYLLWALPLMVFEGRLSWFLLPGLTLLYYLRFHLEYQALGSAQEVARARATFDFGVVWWEFGPFFAALFLESVWRRWRLRKTSEG